MTKKMKKEFSAMNNIAVAQAPKKVKNDNTDLLNMVIKAILQNQDLEEVVRNRGDSWVLYDDDKDTERGVYKDRKTAWRQQRIYRKAQSAQKKKNRESKRNSSKMFSPKDVKKKSAQQKPAAKEGFDFARAKALIKESVLTYMFDHPEESDSARWDMILKKAPKETVMSDNKLKGMLTDIAKAEVQVLVKAFNLLKKHSDLDVKGSKPSINEETQELELPFTVTLKESGVELSFSIGIENGRPLIKIPDDVRDELNNMHDTESKMLRAELISVQEKELNDLDDVVKSAEKRDAYLRSIESKLDKDVNKLSAMELVVLKDLVKNKFKAK